MKQQGVIPDFHFSGIQSDVLQAGFCSCEREKYFSTIPGFLSVPTISSVDKRVSRTNSLSFMICSNWFTDSTNLKIVSLSFISFGRIKPRLNELKLLRCLLFSLVVLVRKR